MTSRLYVGEVKLEGDWNPLFERLPKWKREGEYFTDRDRKFYDNTQRGFALEARTDEAWERVKNLGEVEDDRILVKSLSGLEIPIYRSSFKNQDEEKKYLLNHVAVTVSDLDREQTWWQQLLYSDEALRVDQGWDPLLDGPLDATHFYKSPLFYVTLRKDKRAGVMHHFGFEARNKEAVLDAKNILQEIGWRVFWEGTIDKSYVLHFEGPDGWIHDFFSTSNELREAQRE